MSRRSIPFSYKMRYPQQTRLIARLSGAGEAIEMRRQASATPPALTGMELLRKLAFQSGSLPCDMSLPHRKTRFPRRIPVSKSMRWNSYSSLRIISWPPFFAELGAARPPCTFSGLPASLWRRASCLSAFFRWAWQERRSLRSAQIAFCAAAFVPQQRPGRRKALPAPPTAQSRDSAGSSSKRAPLSTPYRAGMRTEVKNLLVNVLRHPYRAGARAILVQPRFSLPRAASHLTGIRLPRPLPCIQYFIPR